MRGSVLVAAGAMIVAGPAVAEVIHVEGIFAAGSREASRLPTIGVDLFGGPAGDALGVAIERRLAALGRDGVPHAQIIAPSLRPDGLLSGRASSSVDQSGYTESRERCAEKKDDKCVRRVRYKVACLQRTVTLRADLRLTRQRDDRILYAFAPTRSDSSQWCEDEAGGLGADVAVQSMVESIADQVRLDLAPHREQYKIRIREERDGLPPALADRFRAAVHQTKQDEPAACAAFASIGAAAPDHGPTLFNQALCAESAGRYAEAAALYTRARVFAPRAGGEISRGLERTASLAAGAEDVKHMAAL
ncbi:hypothetical protein [Sphingomonas abaci]|uniref:Tetratricopeptide repeat protein n=1 Tax=Sphingomonas abaci TaxID=237611 RepID=A0A7W7AJS0_9SPHN|nr:hypothetical protein [Sphingomonas abaci]MBB4617490.1 hypothetical protein [Sphingomonas abaci]